MAMAVLMNAIGYNVTEHNVDTAFFAEGWASRFPHKEMTHWIVLRGLYFCYPQKRLCVALGGWVVRFNGQVSNVV